MIPIAKPMIGEEEKRAALAALSSGMLTSGPKVEEFEGDFAKFIGTRHAVAASNGTTALHMAMLAHGIGAGDEVITVSFTFIASANCIKYVGAKPVFVDIGGDFCMDADLIEKKITKRTKAILPVHLYGYPCDISHIREIADKHGLALIEDACQAHGASENGKKVGSFGTGCFSFYPTKNMTTTEGGMITTDDAEIAEKCRLLRSQGMKVRYYHDMLGYNFRMTDVAASIGIEQLKKLPEFNKKRIANAAYLGKNIGAGSITIPTVAKNKVHVFHQYTIRVEDGYKNGMGRDAVAKMLNGKGIGTGIYYPVPVHRQKIYSEYAGQPDLKKSEGAAAQVISLPVHPALTKDDLEKIAAAFE